MSEQLDEIDRELINQLQNNPEIDIEELRDIINHNLNRRLSISTIYHRKNKLLDNKILRSEYAPDYLRINKATLCFIALKFEGHEENIFQQLREMNNVMEVHAVGGQYDAFLKVRGRDIHEIADLVFQIRTDYPIVKTTEIFFVLKTEKETLSIGI